MRGWHARDPKREAPLDAAGRPALVLEILNTGERFVLPVVSAEGRFSAETLDLAAHALRDQRSNREFPVDPEVLATLYRLQLHFQAHSLRVVSAYRAARPGGHSRHGQGRAVDLVVPGATDREVAAFARGLGYSGVGVYLVSGFVHVDVRPRSYAWVDLSGPGQPNRARSAGGKELAEADARARAAGRAAPRDAVTPTSDIEAALAGARGEASGPPHDEPDRDDSDDSDDSDAELDAASGAGE
ncbi:MAG: DUF882 domain-containing protein [Sorangiineae bacterium]|nr:DUF882 domain-containing protein [Polyangiaceae bacterium]MEB2324941.1 DUF882 domain-containing protein [Sorangiineae bacterium]